MSAAPAASTRLVPVGQVRPGQVLVTATGQRRPVLAVRPAPGGGVALTVACPELADGRARLWGEARPGRLVHLLVDGGSAPAASNDREGWA
jgi:hypothetical protein